MNVKMTFPMLYLTFALIPPKGWISAGKKGHGPKVDQ